MRDPTRSIDGLGALIFAVFVGFAMLSEAQKAGHVQRDLGVFVLSGPGNQVNETIVSAALQFIGGFARILSADDLRGSSDPEVNLAFVENSVTHLARELGEALDEEAALLVWRQAAERFLDTQRRMRRRLVLVDVRLLTEPSRDVLSFLSQRLGRPVQLVAPDEFEIAPPSALGLVRAAALFDAHPEAQALRQEIEAACLGADRDVIDADVEAAAIQEAFQTRSQLRQAEAERDRLANELAAARAASQVREAELIAERDRAASALAQSEGRVAESEVELGLLRDNIALQVKHGEEAASRLAQAEGQLAERAAAVEASQVREAGLIAERDRVASALAQSEGRVAEAAAELGALREKFDLQVKHGEETASRLAQAEAEVAARTAALKDAQRGLDGSAVESDLLRENIRLQLDMAASLADEQDQLREANILFQSAVAEAKIKESDLLKSLLSEKERHRKQVSDSDAALQNVTSELAAVRARESVATVERDGAAAELEAAQAQVSVLLAELSTSVEDIRSRDLQIKAISEQFLIEKVDLRHSDYKSDLILQTALDEVAEARQGRSVLHREIENLRNEVENLVVTNGKLTEAVAAKDAHLKELLASTSWRLTAPIRAVANTVGAA